MKSSTRQLLVIGIVALGLVLIGLALVCWTGASVSLYYERRQVQDELVPVLEEYLEHGEVETENTLLTGNGVIMIISGEDIRGKGRPAILYEGEGHPHFPQRVIITRL